jgi:hypothetical protein
MTKPKKKSTPKKPARPYSLAYTAAGTPRRYLLSGIPAQFWINVQAQAKREHVAVRQVILTLLEGWLDAHHPARAPKPTPKPRKDRRLSLRRAVPLMVSGQGRLPFRVP